MFTLFRWYPTASRAQTRAMAAAASAAGGAAGAAPRPRGSSLAARQQAVYMNPNSACTLGPLPAGAKNAANALSDERPTRLSENLRICYPHLTAKSDQYGNRTTAETQLVQVKEGVKDPQVIGAFSGIFNLLEGFDTSMIEDKSFRNTAAYAWLVFCRPCFWAKWS